MPAATDKVRLSPVSSNGTQSNPNQPGKWDRVPSPLPEYRQWVVWQAEARGDRTAKVPIDPVTGKRLADWQHPNQHLSFSEAVQYHAEGIGDGIGFVCTGTDGLVWLDIDKAINEDGELADAVYAMLRQLDAPGELSLSGQGYHVPVYAPNVAQAIQAQGTGKLLLDGKQHGFGGLEVFVTNCFIANTGDFRNPQLTKVPNRDQVLDRLLREMWPDKWPPATRQESSPATYTSGTVTKSSRPAAPLSEADSIMLQRMLSQRDRGKFRKLFGKIDAPPLPISNTLGYDTRSHTDMALACKVAFRCFGKNGRGIDQARRIMWASQLRRDKWNERRGTTTYLDLTIAGALEFVMANGGVWNGNPNKRAYKYKQPPAALVPPVPRDRLEKDTLSESKLIDLDLNAAERATYYALRDQNRGDSFCHPSQSFLAKKLGITVRSVRSHIRSLEKGGILISEPWQRRDGKRSKVNMYWFLKIPENLSGERE